MCFEHDTGEQPYYYLSRGDANRACNTNTTQLFSLYILAMAVAVTSYVATILYPRAQYSSFIDS